VDAAGRGWAWLGGVRQGVARLGQPWPGRARHGAAGQGMVGKIPSFSPQLGWGEGVDNSLSPTYRLLLSTLL